MVPAHILNVLKKFVQLIDGKDIPWILSGSTSLVIQGVDVQINNDIDILTTEVGSKQINILMDEYKVKESKFSSTDKYQSFFGIYKIDGVNIDVMGEFQYRLRNGSWSEPNQNHKIFIKEYQGMSLPLLSLEQELVEYDNMGKTEKVEKIKPVLQRIQYKACFYN
ncbi:MAG: hypothetical protein WC663_03395 [Patescibacteria group bacterium]|jgi:hypothetical protein